MTFLASLDPRPLSATALPSGVTPVGLFLGAGRMALEIAVYQFRHEPANAELRGLLTNRKGKRATPVLIVALWGDEKASLIGSIVADEVAIVPSADRSQAEQLCQAAHDAPDRHAAARLLSSALSELDSAIPGLRNSGLFALHELEEGVPHRHDWSASTERSSRLLNLRGRALLEGLSFSIQPLQGPESLLVANGTDVAIALFLERPDDIEPASAHFGNTSPISHALAKADQKNLDYVVISAGSVLRIYPVKPGVGTGRRGRTETYAEFNLDLLAPARAGYLWLIASADALVPHGTFTEILDSSALYAADLGGRLRERVYDEVVPRLADAVVKARRLRSPTPEKLALTYEMTLLVLFRLLFLAYAEDKELLPLHLNASYRKHSLKEMARQLADAAARGQQFEREDFYWTEVQQLWKAVDKGNRSWGVPAYNGGLFASDGAANQAGRTLADLTLPDSAFAPALQALLLDDTGDGTRGPIDFRSLGVREFGTIYEGLLESELSVAESDLAVDRKTQAYLPVKGRAAVVVREGEVYLHNASGARKASGAYYTKSFAVEHLLDHALEPALQAHLARLDSLPNDAARAEHFFDFRVADIAMGSGHFLVAAIDWIERGLSSYLARHPLAGVTDELERLRQTASETLGADWTGDVIEDTQLLRRQIARRCIFGVDLNPLAVELARLSIWIHTFVPGLPLSFLDGNLVIGNSLVGVATFEEAREVLGAGLGLFEASADEMLGVIRPLAARLARLAEADAAEVKEARQLHTEMKRRIEHVSGVFDVVTAARIDDTIRGKVDSALVGRLKVEQGDAFTDSLVTKARRALAGLNPLHFPIAFPQVFLGKRNGFDVILGNPPWEKVHVEEHEFWARYYPGFRGLKQSERELRLPKLKRQRPDLVHLFDEERRRVDAFRAILLAGPYPGMGSGHPDLYKAFCWRFWQLVAHDGGCIGVVLPRAVFAAKGSEEFRRALFSDGGATELTMLLNSRGWVFDNAHPRYTIALSVIRKGAAPTLRELSLDGPYASLLAFKAGRVREAARFPYAAVRKWTDSMALPLLPSPRSADVFIKMRGSPRLNDAGGNRWKARAIQGDLNATMGRPFMDFKKEPSATRWPVYAGESFDLWTPATSKYYAVAGARELCQHLQEKRLSSARQRRSVFAEFSNAVLRDPLSLACRHPRIAFRDVSRATDSRTVRVALVPAEVFLVHNAPFLLWPLGNQSDQAYLLGVMCSLPFDWYARRFVETHLTFDILNGLPVPASDAANALRRNVVHTAAQLAAPDDRFAKWSLPLGIEPRARAEDEKDNLIAELDAAVAHLYGLAEPDLVHIFETFHNGWDYQDRLDATLKQYGRLRPLA